MKIYHSDNQSRWIKNLYAVFVVFCFLAIYPLSVWAGSSKSTSLAVSHKRLQVELYGGFAMLSPADLNLFVDYDDMIQGFMYDIYLDYLQINGQIRSWTKNQPDTRKKIKNSFPVGLRLKYHLNSMMAVSVGFKYISRQHESNLEFQYTRNELSDEQYIERTRLLPYSLSAEAYIPMVGIHVMKRINDSLMLEGYVFGGPMFAECRYLSEWYYEWSTQGPNYHYVTFQNDGSLEEKGTGVGIALDLGARLNYPLVEGLGVFLEGGYAYQAVTNISGEGREVIGNSSETWDGRWKIEDEKITAPWGNLNLELPTNYSSDGSNQNKIRDFKLDLSGFQLRMGLFYRF